MPETDETPPGAPRFDSGLGAWVLSRYGDVAAALREPRLAFAGGEAGAGVGRGYADEAAMLASTQVDRWREVLVPEALALADRLPTGSSVDLVAELAHPFAKVLAGRVLGVPPAQVEAMLAPAEVVFLSAACSTSGEPESASLSATVELARLLSGAGARLAVQSFVAVTHTLPGFLAGAWLSLLRRPDQLRLLRDQPSLLPDAIEELLRLAGPSSAVFRVAREDLTLGGTRIGGGERVILRLAAANRDPGRFPDPDRLDLRRGDRQHLAFGAAPHACPGARLIRVAAALCTGALLGRTAHVELAGSVSWTGGYAIRAPATLPVTLRREGITP